MGKVTSQMLQKIEIFLRTKSAEGRAGIEKQQQKQRDSDWERNGNTGTRRQGNG